MWHDLEQDDGTSWHRCIMLMLLVTLMLNDAKGMQINDDIRV